MFLKNNGLLQDPGICYPHFNPDLDFNDYISACRTLVKTTRRDLTTAKDPELIITANTPYELKPQTSSTKYGALLLHGLYDSPLVMRDIGNNLQAQGLLVRSVLLPGHGTVPGALLNVTYQDWLQTTYYGITCLTRAVDKIFLVGFSTGASLALYYLLQNSNNKIAGTILLAPALQISAAASIANLPPKVGKLWSEVTSEIDYAKYRSFCYNSIYQIYQLTQAIATLQSSNTLSCPLLIIISRDDKTVYSKATLDFFARHASKDSELIFYTPTRYSGNDKRIISRPATYPLQNIINISHIAIPIAPDNLHYGKNGDYIYASHAEKKYIYGSYTPLEKDWFNLLYCLGLTRNKYTRLTFNPDFDFLLTSINRFIRHCQRE